MQHVGITTELDDEVGFGLACQLGIPRFIVILAEVGRSGLFAQKVGDANKPLIRSPHAKPRLVDHLRASLHGGPRGGLGGLRIGVVDDDNVQALSAEMLKIVSLVLHATVGESLQQRIARIARDAVVRLFQRETLHP